MAEHDRHDRHDPLLVAALADRELDGHEAEAARALVSACADCAALHADLLALASATRALPTPPRPRDFRLRPSDAERLRPGLLRRLLRRLGTTPETVGRPLALGLTTIGFAGLLVAALPAVTPATGGAATELRGAAPAPSDAEIRIQGEEPRAPELVPDGFDTPAAVEPGFNVPLGIASVASIALGIVVFALRGRPRGGRGNRAPPRTV